MSLSNVGSDGLNVCFFSTNQFARIFENLASVNTRKFWQLCQQMNTFWWNVPLFSHFIEHGCTMNPAWDTLAHRCLSTKITRDGSLSPNFSKMNTGTHMKEGSHYIVCCVFECIYFLRFCLFTCQLTINRCQTMIPDTIMGEDVCNTELPAKWQFFSRPCRAA